MEVIVHSTLSKMPGQLMIPVDTDQTVDSIISAFCIEKGQLHSKHYVLRNSQHDILLNSCKIESCGIQNGDTLYLGFRAVNEEWLFGCNQWWLLAAVALIIGSIGIVAVAIIKVQGGFQPFTYGIVIDAGSSHSTIYVYKWEGDKENGTAEAKQIYLEKANGGGISSYVDHPMEAGKSLQGIIESAKRIVPNSEHLSTEIFLGATAGMRLLEQSDPLTSEKIIASVRQTLSESGFSFTSPEVMARIINGSEEGSFSWVTANYLASRFGEFSSDRALSHSPLQSTFGALDLGGASTQITFIPHSHTSIIPDYQEDLVLFGYPYSVYTHSYLCYGINEAKRMLEAHLVKNTTYEFIGTSDSEECRNYVKKLFNFSAPCPYPSCSFSQIYQPPVYGEFKAFSTFYYTISFLNLTQPSVTSLADFMIATKKYCSKTWKEVLEVPHDPSQAAFLAQYCFNAHYIDVLLTDAYNFTADNWNTITFQEKIEGSDLGWSLGFMLNSSNVIPATYPSQPISSVVFIVLVVLFAIFLILSVLFACYAHKSSNRNQSKYSKLSNYGTV